MKIKFASKAKKQLKRLPKSEAKKVIKKIHLLNNYPFAGKRLKGKLQEEYSLKAWPHRIVYLIRKSTVFIETIEHRQGVYK